MTPNRRNFALLLLAVALGSTLAAQGRELVVGKKPNDPYAEIKDAVAVAQAGDRILVANGSYLGFTIRKGVRILAAPGGVRVGPVSIETLAAGETLVIRGLVFQPLLAQPSLAIRTCAGTVSLEDCSIQNNTTLFVRAARDLRLVRSTIAAPLDATDSYLMLDEARIFVPASVLGRFPFAGLTLRNATARLTHSVAQASQPSASFYAAPGIAMLGSSFLDVRGRSAIYAGGGQVSLTASAVNGNGSMLYDPRVTLRPAGTTVPIAATIRATRAQLPTLEATTARMGTSQVLRMQDQAGALGLVLLGLPLTPVEVPVLFGAFTHQMQVPIFSTNFPSTEARFDFPIPVDRRFLGLPISWQAIAGDAARGFKLTNAVTTVVTDR